MLREPFAVGNSPIHQLDPRIRLLSASVYSIVVALSRNFQVLTAAVIISSLLVILAQLPAREILKKKKDLNFLLKSTILLLRKETRAERFLFLAL